jgi:hypothetical protein
MRFIIVVAALLLCACTLVSQDQVTPTPAIPTVTFQFPTNNVAVAEGTDLQIQLVAQDIVGIARIELMVDSQFHQEASPVEGESVPIFTVDMNWLAEGVGLHALEAVAYRLDGTSSRPVLINVNVTSPDAAQAPAQGSSPSSGG